MPEARLRVEPHHQGQYVYVSKPGEIGPYAPDQYDCWITLGKAGDFRSFMPRPVNDERLYLLTGDSHWSLPEVDLEFVVVLENRPNALVKLHRNPEGRLSCLQVIGFPASDPEQAFNVAFGYFHAAMLAACLRSMVPVNYRGALVKSRAHGYWRAAIRPDFPVIPVSVPEQFAPTALQRLVGPSFIEGLRSPFPFYALLCFFRIIEFIDKRWHRITLALDKYGLGKNRERVLMPEDPMNEVAPQYVGRKALDVAKELENEYRDFVAHLDEKDRYPMWSLTGEERYKVAAVVAKNAARMLINSVDRDIARLLAAGMPLHELLDIFDLKRAYPEPVGSSDGLERAKGAIEA